MCDYQTHHPSHFTTSTCQYHSISFFSHSHETIFQFNFHTNSPFGPSTTKSPLSTPKSIGCSGWSSSRTRWMQCAPTVSKSCKWTRCPEGSQRRCHSHPQPPSTKQHHRAPQRWRQASDLKRWVLLRCNFPNLHAPTVNRMTTTDLETENDVFFCSQIFSLVGDGRETGA